MNNQNIEEILKTRFDKSSFINLINNDIKYFDELTRISLTNHQPEGWRAAWMLNHVIIKNDTRLRKHITSILKSLDDKRDGHQRELLKLLASIEFNEDYEAHLFDKCIEIWSDISKQPSVRITAFRILVKTTKKYPELTNEIISLTDKHFYDNLSIGIKNSFFKMLQEIKMPPR